MRILVTGGSGYLGSHLVRTIIKNGDIPIVVDTEYPIFDVPFVQGDICDKNVLNICFEEYHIDCVVHLASFISVGEGETDPHSYYYNNVVSTLNVLKCMEEYNVKNIVFASSAAVYGESEGYITEESPKEPISVYGRSKLMCEKIIEDFCNTHNFKFAILRFFNLSGRSLAVPFKRKTSMHLLDIAEDVAQGKKEVLNVFGGDYPTKDGSCLRDYVHVMDVVNAILLSINLKTSTHINIGSVHASVFDVLKNFNIPFKIVERRKGDPHTLLNVSNKAKEVLNWEPEYTTIEEIIGSIKSANFD
jgi:UDP-glucose 4-epimerase